MTDARVEITREAIGGAVRPLHPAAFVYSKDPERPVLVDDGHCWLLFFEGQQGGVRYVCDGEVMPPVDDQAQLEQILVTVAVAYRSLSTEAHEQATRHRGRLGQLAGDDVYRCAQEYARVQLGVESVGR